jgi:hypothetical protein
LLTAFLTVVALWQIPPPDDPLVKKTVAKDAKDSDTSARGANGTKDSSPFTTRFGQTVLAGLGGLIVAEVTKALGTSSPGTDTKWYYITYFIVFFFVLLLSLNFLRAIAEALRSRVAVIHYPFIRPRGKGWIEYQVERFRDWFHSLRVPVLTFFDTFINLIQGKNQTTTQAFTDAIIEQQRNVIRVADMIRKKLTSSLLSRLREMADKEKRSMGHVRVNISVLSADQSNVFYISRSPGSAVLPFPKISVAWVSVFTGKIRWWESNYKDKEIVLFDNSDKTVPDAPGELMLRDYYQYRDGDYEAFVVLPVPYPQRAFGSNYVKGAIQISFSSKYDFESIWGKDADLVPRTVAVPPAAPPAAAPPAAPPPAGPPAAPPAGAAPATPAAPAAKITYPQADRMLEDWCQDVEIRTALPDAVDVLGELLHGFNEVIYKNYIQPTQGD